MKDKKRIVCLLAGVVMLLWMGCGCASTEPSNNETSPTTVAPEHPTGEDEAEFVPFPSENEENTYLNAVDTETLPSETDITIPATEGLDTSVDDTPSAEITEPTEAEHSELPFVPFE